MDSVANDIALVQGIVQEGVAFLQKYSWQIVAAAVILVIGVVVSNAVHNGIVKAFKQKMDETLLSFLAGTIRFALITFTALIVLNKLGITIAPLIAAISAGIFGATFAIQAPVANYASGLIIILTRPFKIGHVVTIQGYTGTVESITLPLTYLRTEEEEIIQIPNKFIMGEILTNSQDYRFVESSIGISYDSDIDRAIEIVSEAIQKDNAVENKDTVRVGISEFGDSAIVIQYRYNVLDKEFHPAQFRINKVILSQFKTNNIDIPFPQRTITVTSQTSDITRGA